MKLLSLFFIFCIITQFAKAENKIYYNKRGHITPDSVTSDFYRIIKPIKNSFWLVMDYTMSGQIVKKGYTQDSLKATKGKWYKYHGPLFKYSKTGQIKSIEKYKNNKKEGECVYFNSNSFPYKKVYYWKNIPSYEKTFYETGYLEDSISYEYTSSLDTTFKTIISYHPNQVLARKDQFVNNKFVEGICYDTTGMVCNYIPYYQPPEFVGGKYELKSYLNNMLKYPVNAQKKGIEGRVYVEFELNISGQIHDARIKRSSGNRELDYEALRVVNRMPIWKPAMQKGQAVPISFILPVNFKLN